MSVSTWRNFKLMLPLVMIVVFLALPLVMQDPYIMQLFIMTFIWAIVATNWNLTLGYGGMFHIAQIALFAIGGYVSAISVASFELSPWIGLLLGGIFAALASLLIGMPSLRVQGIYLILLTFAFHYGIHQLVIIFRNITGGTIGLMIPSMLSGDTAYYYLTLFILIVSLLVTFGIEKSFVGKALMATRDSEVLAISSGINPYKYKLLTFVLAAFITGITGGVYTSYLTVIGPEIFSFSLIVNGLGMIVIGGMGSLFGPLIGSFFMTMFMELFSSFQDIRPIIIGIVILVMLRYAPNGIVATFNRWTKKD